jgi:hypothetical protein
MHIHVSFFKSIHFFISNIRALDITHKRAINLPASIASYNYLTFHAIFFAHCHFENVLIKISFQF